MANETPWQSQKMAYDASGNIEYLGKNKTPDADLKDGSWYVTKFSYDGDGNMTDIVGPRLGAWADRASMF